MRLLLGSIDPALPIADVATLQGTLDAAIAPRRFLLRLFVVFASCAAPSSIVRLAMRYGVRIALVRVTTGLALALMGARYLRVDLYEVSPLDVWAHAGVVVGLASVVLLASYPAARRAARLDPVASLKRD